MSIENQCKQMDIVIKRLKDMDLYVLSDVVDYAKGKLISLYAELEEYQKATELSGKVNLKLMQELMDKPAVAVPEQVKNILTRIALWHDQFPPTGKFYDEEKTRPTSYGAEYGSNGERDYMRGLASEALEILAAPSHSQQSAPEIPDCFSRLYEHSRGMKFGQDWNEGTAAHNHRNKLLLAVRDCEDFYRSNYKPCIDESIKDAIRYRRLRVIGVAPCGSEQLEQSAVLRFQGLDSYVDADIATVIRGGEVVCDSAQPNSQSRGLFNAEDLNIIRQWYNCIEDCNAPYLQASGFDDKAVYQKVLNAIGRCPSHDSDQDKNIKHNQTR